MWFLFALQLISGSLIFQPAKCASCDKADWSVSLDRAIWSTCPKRNTYLRGLWRSPRKARDERVGRIEYGRCCQAIDPVIPISLQPAQMPTGYTHWIGELFEK